MTVDIKAMRELRGWTQDDVARLVNEATGRKYARGKVSQWENGKIPVPKVVDALLEQISADDYIPPPPDDPFAAEGDRSGDSAPPPPPGMPTGEQVAGNLASLVGGGGYSRVCEELWELVATGVGMVGAVTGSESLQNDGKIILGDKVALGKAWGKLAEQNATFRNMLVGMSGGGAWLEVALVSGITAGKLMRNHQTMKPQVVDHGPQNVEKDPGSNGRMYGDGAVIDLSV